MDKNCPCNCHDKETREAMNMTEHRDCAECRKALRSEAEALREMDDAAASDRDGYLM